MTHLSSWTFGLPLLFSHTTYHPPKLAYRPSYFILSSPSSVLHPSYIFLTHLPSSQFGLSAFLFYSSITICHPPKLVFWPSAFILTHHLLSLQVGLLAILFQSLTTTCHPPRLTFWPSFTSPSSSTTVILNRDQPQVLLKNVDVGGAAYNTFNRVGPKYPSKDLTIDQTRSFSRS